MIYQDLRGRYMSQGEQDFRKELQAKDLPEAEVYAILFEYKT